MPPSHRGDTWADHKHRASSKIVDPISSKSHCYKKEKKFKYKKRGSVYTHTHRFLPLAYLWEVLY